MGKGGKEDGQLSKSQKIYHQMLEERHYTSEYKAKNKSPY